MVNSEENPHFETLWYGIANSVTDLATIQIYTIVPLILDFAAQKKDRGRNETLVCLAPPSEPDLQISRIRLSS